PGDRRDGGLPGRRRRRLHDGAGRLPELRDGHLTVALVTGAATGIGLVTAELLEQRGFRVARNHLPGQTVSGYSAPADVADPDAVNAMVARVQEDLGPVQVLVANAAEMVMGEIDQVAEDAFWRIVDVNLSGVFHCARACVPDMIAAGHGRIVA